MFMADKNSIACQHVTGSTSSLQRQIHELNIQRIDRCFY